MHKDQGLDNLWLARALWDLGAVSFGDYTLGGSTVNSPVFVNPKLLISHPTALRVAAKLMYQEVTLAQSLRRTRMLSYDVVAGVPVGGLLLAEAYSLESGIPLIYSRPKPEGTGPRGIEGRYTPGSRALVIDDLIAGGSSILDVAHFLGEHDLTIHDAVVLIDRGPDTRLRLKHAGINLISILKLDVMMNLYHSNGLIDDEQYQRYLDYVKANQHAQAEEEHQGVPSEKPGEKPDK